MERHLLVCRIKTPDGTILESHGGEMASHKDKNGETYFLDLLSLQDMLYRTSMNKEKAVDASIYTDSPFEEIRENFKRGTWDKEGNRIWKPLCECSDAHLVNIIKYNNKNCPDAPKWYEETIRREIEYRKEHNIHIEDYFIDNF